VIENVIASNVDTVSAIIAATDIRARFMTDGGDWGQQRTARHLEFYSEALGKDLGVLAACRSAFKECAKKGTGITKAEIIFDEVRIRRVFVENVIVDDNECAGGRAPKQMGEWEYVDVDELIARYPKHEAAIENARKVRGSWRRWRSSQMVDNDVEVLHVYRLPVGKKGVAGYKPGRYVCSIEGTDLCDVKSDKTDLPYAVMVWSERAESFYGIGGAERIAGIQAALNRRNWQIERQLDQGALPTTYVRQADANLVAKTSRVGAIVPIKGEYPKTVIPTAVSGETYQSRLDLREAGNNEFGQSGMATHAAKPAGIDSAVGLREFKDQTTQRFAMQEKGFEQLVLDTIWNMLDCCKDLGAKAPTITRLSRFGSKKVKWSDVDMRDVRFQIAASSNLNRTPSGRMQAVIEYAQAGIITQDEARRLLKHPDLERAMSLYTAALENVEHCLDEIADGGVVMPEPFMNLKMCVWRGQQEYLIWRDNGAPEEVLEALRQFVVQAAHMLEPPAPAMPAAPAMPMDPAMPADPMAAPPMMEGPPMGGAPQAAFAAQAMQTRAA
jgi:hypothetical protein